MGFLTILIIMIVLLSFFRLLGRMLAARRQTSADSSPERNTLAGMFSTRRVDAEVWMACAANTDLEYIRPQNGKGFPCLRGNVNGRLTDVHIQEEDGSCCTVASVLFRAPEKAGLRILLDDEPVLRAFFAGQPVYRLSRIDDPRLRCAASSENALSEALTPVRMNILKNALGFFRYLNVTDQYVMIRVPGICNDEDALVHLINFIISFAGNWEKGPSAFPTGPILVEHAEPVPELKTPKTAPPSSEPVPEREVEFNPESAEEEKEEIPAVPEQEIAAIGADSRMRITVPALGDRTFQAGKVEKGAVANPAAHTYDVRAALANAGGELLPGMVCRVEVSPAGAAEQIALPVRAVQQAGDGSRFVWTVRGDSAVRTAVTTGRLVNNAVVLEDGVRSGDRIVVDGMQKIGEGSKVVW